MAYREMDIEEIRPRFETINLQGEDADQVVHVTMVDQEPEPEKCEVGLADCLDQHHAEIILERANVKGSSENEMESLKTLSIRCHTVITSSKNDLFCDPTTSAK